MGRSFKEHRAAVNHGYASYGRIVRWTVRHRRACGWLPVLPACLSSRRGQVHDHRARLSTHRGVHAFRSGTFCLSKYLPLLRPAGRGWLSVLLCGTYSVPPRFSIFKEPPGNPGLDSD